MDSYAIFYNNAPNVIGGLSKRNGVAIIHGLASQTRINKSNVGVNTLGAQNQVNTQILGNQSRDSITVNTHMDTTFDNSQ
jgi:hypothetical protein